MPFFKLFLVVNSVHRKYGKKDAAKVQGRIQTQNVHPLQTNTDVIPHTHWPWPHTHRNSGGMWCIQVLKRLNTWTMNQHKHRLKQVQGSLSSQTQHINRTGDNHVVGQTKIPYSSTITATLGKWRIQMNRNIKVSPIEKGHLRELEVEQRECR